MQQPSAAASVTLPLDRSGPNDRAADILSEGVNQNVTTSSVSRKLKFLYTNVQSLLSKFEELKIHLCDLSPDVISLTETWLTQHVDDRELALPGYQMFRRDREGRQGGGVLTYVKNGLNVSDKTDNFSCSSEAIWLSIKVPSSPSLDVLTVYRTPRRDNMADARLLEELEKFATRPDILIMGDFNAPHIDWSSTHANSSEQTFDMSFLNTALKLFLNSMFADDIKIWRTIRGEVDEARLPTNLDHLEQWSKDWLLPFNVNKCNFLRVGRTSSPNHTVYRLTGKPLQEVDAQKDLGVGITTSLKPSLQCSKVAKSAMSILYLVKRAFSSFDEDCFAKVF
ncbi:hypothetical protein SprV_0602116100 [Sparganum proliferum]